MKYRFQMKRVATIVACFAIFMMFADCKKDNEAVYLLIEEQHINSLNNMRYVYEYDNQDRITKINSYINETSSVHTFSYNSAGDLTESKYENIQTLYSYKTTFSKNGNKITFTDSFDDGNSCGTLELNAQGLPVTVSYDEESILSIVWQNGNITKTVTDAELIFTFDDMKSPFYHCKSPKWIMFFMIKTLSFESIITNMSENNIKTGSREEGGTITCEYTYNDSGFPATQKAVSGNWTEETIYTYKKK